MILAVIFLLLILCVVFLDVFLIRGHTRIFIEPSPPATRPQGNKKEAR